MRVARENFFPPAPVLQQLIAEERSRDSSDVARALLVESVRTGATKREAMRHAYNELIQMGRHRGQHELEMDWAQLLAKGTVRPRGRRWEVRDQKPCLPPALGDGFPGTLRAVYCPAGTGTRPEIVNLHLTPGETAALFGHLVASCSWWNADISDYPDMQLMGIRAWLATTRPDLDARFEEGSPEGLYLVLHLDKEGWPS